MKRKQKLFDVYKWWSNQVGWVHSSYVLGTSWKDVVTRNPKYGNKHEYLVLESK